MHFPEFEKNPNLQKDYLVYPQECTKKKTICKVVIKYLANTVFELEQCYLHLIISSYAIQQVGVYLPDS